MVLSPDDIERRYRIGPKLQQAWRDAYGQEIDAGIDFPDGSAEKLWAEFRLSANLRGEEVAAAAARHFTRGRPTLSGRRTLDVGCGLGGVAVACARLGAAAWGVDVDPQWLAFARANAADQPRPPRIEAADLLEPGLAGRLGQFDVVTAEDVLEHVADAEAGARALAGLLRDGGVLVTTVPNGDAVAHVRSDPHYALAGLTLLADRADAGAYHATRQGSEAYDVGDYHGYDAYAGWLTAAGLEVVSVEHMGETPLGDLDADLAAAASEVRAAAARLGGELEEALDAGWAAYRERVAAARLLPPAETRRRLTVTAWRFHAAKGRPRRRWSWAEPSTPVLRRLRDFAKRVPGVRRAVDAMRRRLGG